MPVVPYVPTSPPVRTVSTYNCHSVGQPGRGSEAQSLAWADNGTQLRHPIGWPAPKLVSQHSTATVGWVPNAPVPSYLLLCGLST